MKNHGQTPQHEHSHETQAQALLAVAQNQQHPLGAVDSPTERPDDIVLRALGVDPGFGKTGVSAIGRLRDGRLVSLGCWLLVTEKGRNGLREGLDDARRIRELWDQLWSLVNLVQPQVMGVEPYVPRRPKAVDDLKQAATNLVQLGLPRSRDAFITQLQDDKRAAQWITSIGAINASLRDDDGWAGIGLGNASKTIGVVWTAACAAFAAGVPFYTYTPTQLKQYVTRRRDSSKEAVGEALSALIWGLTEHSEPIAPSLRNHVWDAYGQATMALCELEQYRAAMLPTAPRHFDFAQQHNTGTHNAGAAR